MMARMVRRSSPKLPTVRLLLQDVAAGIRVLRTRDGLDISDEQILERARNIVTGLVGNYRIASLDPATTKPHRPRAPPPHRSAGPAGRHRPHGRPDREGSSDRRVTLAPTRSGL